MNIAQLHTYLAYDFSSGVFTYKLRTGKPRFNTRFGGKEAMNTLRPDGYLQGGVRGKLWLAHRAVFAFYHGHVPKEIDHINGVRSDNHISNLREVTRSLNMRNARISTRNTSGVVGVSFSSKDQRWVVKLAGVYLGNFASFDEAVKVRSEAAASNSFHVNHGRMEG